MSYLEKLKSAGTEHTRINVVADSIVSARTVRPDGGRKKAEHDAMRTLSGTGDSGNVPIETI